MASGCIIGRCSLCDEPIWEDEKWVCFSDIGSKWMMHTDCFYDFTGKIKKFIEMLECSIESEGGEK